VAFAPGILEKENLACVEGAGFSVACGEFKFAGEAAEELALWGWMPVAVPA
jgi:hypothetical protein